MKHYHPIKTLLDFENFLIQQPGETVSVVAPA